MKLHIPRDILEFPELHRNNGLNRFLKCKYAVHMLRITCDRIFCNLPSSLGTEKEAAKMTPEDPWSSRQTGHSALQKMRIAIQPNQAGADIFATSIWREWEHN